MTDLNQMAEADERKGDHGGAHGPDGQPALPERTAEHAAHDTSIDAEGEETEGRGRTARTSRSDLRAQAPRGRAAPISSMLVLPTCRFCKRPWLPPEGVDANTSYCEKCSPERREAAHVRSSTVNPT